MQFTQIINMEQRNPHEKLINHQQDQQQPPPPRRAKSLETQTAANNHQPPPPQRCPRCDSSNTKFCYYNNYSLSQPRYFCKACRRYWTHGGTLRNVPVGGGCRKTRRPKPSSSSTNEIARPQSLQSQNLTGMVNPGQGLRATSPVISSMGNSFYATGAFISPLAGLQSLPVGINQGAAVNFNAGGNGLFGGNMALLQGMNLQSVRNPQQFQAQNDIFRSQPSLNNPQRPLNSWVQSLINRSTTTTSAASTTFWGGGNGENQAGSSSFNPNPWSDKNPGFGPSQ